MGRPILDKTGKRYGRLTVLRLAGQDLRNQAIWLCRCDCGELTKVLTGKLGTKHPTRSCGCLRVDSHNGRYVTPLADRFWALVVVTDGCWEWQGARDHGGYGRVGLGRREDGTDVAHRVAYMLCGKTIPEDAVLHHICENPPCVRPDHLQPLTRSEHMNLHREEIN